MNKDVLIGNRYSRFYDAFMADGGTDTTLPWIMVDGGRWWKTGPQSYYNTYKALIDAELKRAPGAEISATVKRVSNDLQVGVNVKNTSGGTLYYDNAHIVGNDAAVTVIVYEDTTPLIAQSPLTSRFIRKVATQNITTPLTNGSTGTYTINTASGQGDLTGVNWSKLHTVVVVEARPGGVTGKFDMLQSAVAQPLPFATQPESLTFLIDNNYEEKSAIVNLTGGPLSYTWQATKDQAWITLDPTSGGTNESFQVHINPTSFSTGTHTGTVTLTVTPTGGSPFQRTIPVTVIMTTVFDIYLPSIRN